MDNNLRAGQAAVINFNVYCEDDAGIVAREGVAEVKLPSIENGERDNTLLLKFNLETITMLANMGIHEKPISKQDIHQIEIRVALQEKDAESGETKIRLVKHILFAELKSLESNVEVYSVTRWKTYHNNRKIRDVFTDPTEQEKEFAEKILAYIEHDHETRTIKITIPENALDEKLRDNTDALIRRMEQFFQTRQNNNEV